MTTHRLVFMPFRRNQVGDFIEESAKAERLGAAGKAHHTRKFDVVWWDDGDNLLKNLGFSCSYRIMIAGHGLAGRPYISNSSGQGQKEYVPFNVAVDRLVDAGLSKKYVGTISTDVCYSAVNNQQFPARCF